MSSRWIEYLETSCNFSPASSRTHLYYCIIEWTLCSIMKVCHIVVPTKLIFSEPNHSLPVDQIVTTLHPKCHIWGEHSLVAVHPGDWLTEPGLENPSFCFSFVILYRKQELRVCINTSKVVIITRVSLSIIFGDKDFIQGIYNVKMFFLKWDKSKRTAFLLSTPCEGVASKM